MKRTTCLAPCLAATVLWTACGGGGDATASTTGEAGEEEHSHDDTTHTHDETPLGTFAIGELQVELAQGHGPIYAGGEGHLVVKLPYSDDGATIVRAWIGTSERTDSYVGKGEYAPSHDDYDVRVLVPDPLPADAKWWIEIERAPGDKLLGSATPLLE